jgi:hypothetical protein
MRRVLCIALVFLCFVSPAFAWNDRGHMLAAMVAYQELKPEVRERVNAVLKQHPQYELLKEGEPTPGPHQDLWVFIRAATWPDMLRSTSNPLHAAEHHSVWHYVNYPISFDGTKGPDPVEAWNGAHDPANILQAIADTKGQLEAKSTKDDRRAIALSWIEHLVGDIHQPLHAVNLYSSIYPKGDSGGNSFAVSRGDTPTTLHSFWDNVLGTSNAMPTLRSQADGWLKNPELSRAKLFGENTGTNVTTWAGESVVIAKQYVYLEGKLNGVRHVDRGDYPKDTPSLPSGYEETAKKIAAQQVMRAGYRMADVLNGALSSPPDKPMGPTPPVP